MTRVEIVGGGIAGLTLARAIHRQGWEIVVRERGRDDQLEVDTAFGLWRPAMDALHEIGLGTAVRQDGIPVSTATVRTAEGRQLMRSTGQDVVMIGRATLRSLLVDALPENIHWVDEHITDSARLEADVVVGADGARSGVRRAHWGPRSSARSPRLTVVRGVVDADLSSGAVSEYWGHGALYGITPLPGGRTNWFTAFPEQRFEGSGQALEHVRGAAREFPAQVSEVLAAATAEQALVSGIHIARPTASFVRGSAVLIGDAAHAMTPNLGRGACEAIRDAVALGALLGAHEPQQALTRYRSRRLVAPQLTRMASSLVTRVALATGPAARVRDRALSRLP